MQTESWCSMIFGITAVVSFIIIITICYILYRKELHNFNIEMSKESQIFESPMGPIQYAIKGDGLPVLIIHGALGGYDQSASIMPFLEGIRGICPSFYGYLKSGTPKDPSITNFAESCIALINHLRIDHFGIIALSAGGPAALHIALKEPRRCLGICMLSTVTKKFAGLPKSQKISFQANKRTSFPYWLISSVCANILIKATGMKNSDMKTLLEDKLALVTCHRFIKGFPIAYRSEATLRHMDELNLLDPIPVENITCPLIIVHGEFDKVVPFEHAKWLSETTPCAELITISGGGHFVMFSHRKEIFEKVNRFFKIRQLSYTQIK